MKSHLSKLRQFFEKLTERLKKLKQTASTTSYPDKAIQGNDAAQIHAPQERPPDPKSAAEAHTRLHQILHSPQSLPEISVYDFMLGWVAMAYIAPGLNPDEVGDEEGGWPEAWQPVAEEAMRRFKSKGLTEEELYPRPY